MGEKPPPLVSPSNSAGVPSSDPPCCGTASTSPANSITSDTSTPSRRYFFPSLKNKEPASTSASSIGSNFSFRKSSVTASARSDPPIATQNAPPEPAKRKKSMVSVTGAAAKRTMRKRFSAAKLALRKLSHGGSTPNVHHRADTNSNASTSPASGIGSPTNDSSSNAPPQSSASLSQLNPTMNPAIEALKKQPLGPSLSWDPGEQQRSRSPSMVSRTRIQSDGCNEDKKRRRSRGSLAQTAANLLLHSTNDSSKQKQKNDDGTDRMSKSSTTSTRRHSQQLAGDKLDLENHCLHCSLGSEYRRNRLRNEIETAVKRLARRLGNNRSIAMSWDHNRDESAASTNSVVSINTPPPDANSANQNEKMHRTMTPDIIVSSISSDEDDSAEPPQPPAFCVFNCLSVSTNS
ncbi:Diacylglycerol kinase [Aphelenchoides bicaudatus]|nr:Diacylglycerol kinase [Aphelenchoides bicaudatus]